jgi:hypothetical protein
MRTMPEKYLSEIAVSKDAYEIDLAVLDRYQSFSAELLRLALLGQAGCGFLIANVVFKAADSSGSLLFFGAFSSARYLLAAGSLSLVVSTACALGHRYFSTDSITHLVRRLRLRKRLTELLESDPERANLEMIVLQESKSLRKDLNRCRWLLLWSSVLLLIGLIGVACSFAVTLFSRPPNA